MLLCLSAPSSPLSTLKLLCYSRLGRTTKRWLRKTGTVHHQLHPPQQTLSSRRRNSLPTATATLTVFMREWIGPRSPSVLRKGHTLSRSTMRVWTQKLNTSSRCCFSVASTRCGEFNLQLLHPSATFYENSITALAFKLTHLHFILGWAVVHRGTQYAHGREYSTAGECSVSAADAASNLRGPKT
jgi:hypothetical protein